tara:strand:- start:110 stop:352 length:243 start_codon:yes stop_codon:yes gene_type:complete
MERKIKEIMERLKKLERDSHPPVKWEKRINTMDDTWKELYHKLVIDYANLKKEVDMLRTILHTYLPILGEDNKNDTGGNI